METIIRNDGIEITINGNVWAWVFWEDFHWHTFGKLGEWDWLDITEFKPVEALQEGK